MTMELTGSPIRPRERRDQLILFGAFVVGMVGTLAVKAANVHPIIVTLVPVGVIMVYAFVAWRNSSTALEPDMIGDNCYYLGFIFTLVSLAWTLYAVAQAPDDLNLVREIISGFGVALSSTITGIFMRAFFLQLRPDVVTAERIARQEIIKATREFRTELDQSIKELKGFSVGVQQALGEHHETLKTSSSDAQNAHREWMQQFAIETAKEASILYRTAVEDWLGTTRQAADATSAAFVTTLETSQAQVSDWMAQSEQRLEKLCDAVDAQTQKTLARIGKVGSSADEVAHQVEVAGTALAIRIAGAATRFAEETKTVTDRIAGFGKDIDQSIGCASSALETAGNGLAAKMLDATGTVRVAAREASDALASTLLQSATTISTASVNAGVEIDASATELAKAGDMIRSAAVSLTGVSKRVVRLASLLDEVEAKLSDLKTLPTRADAALLSRAIEAPEQTTQKIGILLEEHRAQPVMRTNTSRSPVETPRPTPLSTPRPVQVGNKPTTPPYADEGVLHPEPRSRFRELFRFGKKSQ